LVITVNAVMCPSGLTQEKVSGGLSLVSHETMTTDQALEIFWKAYEDYPKRVIGGRDPIRQYDLYKYAMSQVLGAYDKEWTEKYLAMAESDGIRGI
jgi:hypothetical protein